MKFVKRGRGICNFLPVAVALSLIVASVLEAAVLLLLWLSVLLAISVLVFNPWRILDPLIDGRTRGLWSAGLSAAAVAGLCWFPLGWKARAVLGSMAIPLFWLGWKIRRPAAPGPSVIVQSKEGDSLIGQLRAKVNGNGLQRWQDCGKSQARAVLHQAFCYAVTEEELDGTGRVSFALGYEAALTQETALKSRINKLEWQAAHGPSKQKFGEMEEALALCQQESREKDALIDALQEQLREAQSQIPTVIELPTERDEQIRQAVAAGESQASVAARYGLSRQRVHQLVNGK